MTASEFARGSPRDWSVGDLPEGAESGVGGDPATPHQAYARLLRGKPSMACARSGFVLASRGAEKPLVDCRERFASAFKSDSANPASLDSSGAAWMPPTIEARPS